MPYISVHRNKTIVLSAFIILTALLLFLQVSDLSNQVYHYVYPKAGIHCYRYKTATLPEITDAHPKKGRSIFFHETSCNSYYNGKITIGARQACAVESAANMNPNFDVYLFGENTQSDRILKALLTYKNLNILHLDFEKYTKNTPVEDLYTSGAIENSDYPMSHASDVLRYLTLWKYGGIYLDLDVVVIKSLENIQPNYAGSESDFNVAAGILSFSPTASAIIWRKPVWMTSKAALTATTGATTVQVLLRSICGVHKAKEMSHRDCQGFSVYPQEKFYAIPWWNWTMYFDAAAADTVFKLSKNSQIIHVWNKHSEHIQIPLSSGTPAPYLMYAKEFCPKTVEQCDEFFLIAIRYAYE
ncbi:hypothetical protein NQ317_015847 [Molorchus minor]|uniref:Alpha 1,4-glycosyltransferase domain-containing protein n=1 Tax=Molorchus minor TaxID=1323400 RepID=A0ABQ9JQB2_9CUCU|nr:hypothetical protein NQ317_015847 [Molorchus minor]